MPLDARPKREPPRVAVAVKVRIWGLDSSGKPFSQTAQTVDITPTGVRLQGVSCIAHAGETIGVQFGREKARFQVVWVGCPETPTEGMIGLSSMEPEKFIWKEIWPQELPIPVTAAAGYVGHDRRLLARYACDGGADITVRGKASRWVNVRDISAGGAYLEAPDPPEIHSPLKASVRIKDIVFEAEAVVRSTKPGAGAGIAFTSMTIESRKRLDELLRRLQSGGSTPVVPEPVVFQAEPEEPEILRWDLDRAAALEVAPEPVSHAGEQSDSAADSKTQAILDQMATLDQELGSLQQSLRADSAGMDAWLVRDLCGAAEHFRKLSHAVQHGNRVAAQHPDASAVLGEEQNERMRFCTELAKELAIDLEAGELDLTHKQARQLYREVKRLSSGLGHTLGKER